MKIVHVSVSSKGGAGIAAYRIHQALLKNGIDSHFICLDRDIKDANVSRPDLRFQKVKKINLLDKFVDKVKWRLRHHLNINIITKREDLTKKLGTIYPRLDCGIATLPFSGYNLLEDPFIKNADIIHLHWVAALLDYPTFFKHVRQPVVWTLHDMNPFQGLFHYKEDEERNKLIASSIDREVLKIKRKSIKPKSSQISIVTPSRWLLDAALQSEVFKNVKGYNIPYPLDSEIFSPASNDNLKTFLNIPESHIIFLFIAQSVKDRRKGFDLLINALRNLNQRNISLLVIGKSDYFENKDLNVIMLGTIEDEHTLSKYYSVADAFIISSREDNLPNVMLESLACGTPVISFDVGGMAEFIKNGFNGMKAKKTCANELANVLNEFITSKDNYSKEAIRNFALANFSENLIAEKYKEVYETIKKINPKVGHN